MLSPKENISYFPKSTTKSLTSPGPFRFFFPGRKRPSLHQLEDILLNYEPETIRSPLIAFMRVLYHRNRRVSWGGEGEVRGTRDCRQQDAVGLPPEVACFESMKTPCCQDQLRLRMFLSLFPSRCLETVSQSSTLPLMLHLRISADPKLTRQIWLLL